MPTRIWWTRLQCDDGRSLLYSPRFARTYRVNDDLATGAALPRLLGLRDAAFLDPLTDPAVAADGIDASESAVTTGRLVPWAYAFVHHHRVLGSIKRTLRVARFLARLPSRHRLTPSEIGGVVMAVERAAGISDCYPRALLTAYLCMASGLDCAVTIGILAPTPNMHAWCSVDGVIPYEPVPEHWFFSPLAVFAITG